MNHLKIHHGGEVAGSMFNSEVFADPEELKNFLLEKLLEEISYDQFNRAELTLEINGTEKPMGWSGVKSMEEIRNAFPEAVIEKKIRTPGGEEGEVNGIDGAWYPESKYNSETKKMEVLIKPDGSIKNPQGKFEPEANIVTIPAENAEEYKKIAETNKITIIIEKNNQTQKPFVRTVFPGENAPAFPAQFNSENYKADSLSSDSIESKFWKDHAFIQTIK